MTSWHSGVEAAQAVLYGAQEYESPIDTRLLNVIGNISMGAAVTVGVVGSVMLWRQHRHFKRYGDLNENIPSQHQAVKNESSSEEDTPRQGR